VITSFTRGGIPQYVNDVGMELGRRSSKARWVEGVVLVGSHAGGGCLRNKWRADAQQVAGRAGNCWIGAGEEGGGRQRTRDFRASGGKQGRAGALSRPGHLLKPKGMEGQEIMWEAAERCGKLPG
jgi:hypothetical protein